MAEYLTYPFRYLRITQHYNGTISHKPHWYGQLKNNTFGTLPGLKDYPIDEGGKDGNRDPCFARVDMVVKKIYGVGNRGTNTIWLESADKVKLANGKTDYITLMLTHPNDSDIGRLKVGMKIKAGEYICYEGADGATGNHIHMSVGTGHMSGGGWAQNANGKWVLTVTGTVLKPEQAFYIDAKQTTVLNCAGITFKQLPAKAQKASSTPTESTAKKYKTGDYRVATAYLNVRKGAGANYALVRFSGLTKNAQAQILKLNHGAQSDAFVKGMEVTITEVKGNWGKCPSGWICLDYCTTI